MASQLAGPLAWGAFAICPGSIPDVPLVDFNE